MGHSVLNLNPLLRMDFFNFTSAFGPMPCKSTISASVNVANRVKLLMFLLAKARRAGAATNLRLRSVC